MEEIISGSVYFGLALTCGAYVAGCVVHKAAKTPLLNPLIVTNVLVIAFLAVTGISYESYFKGARYIGDLLTPATVCLAIPLYRQLHLLKKHAAAIFCGIAAGVLANALCVTLLPKSITAAIAMKLTEEYGGIAAITLISTVITGAFGYIAAPSILKLFRVTEVVAKGVAIGSGSHAFGTIRAFELGEAEGAMSSLAIAATGLMTVAAAPLFVLLF